MTAATIGALRVTLGADTAAFEQGLNRAQRELAKTGKQMSALGDKLQGIGAKMTLGLTTPIVAIGVAMSKAAIDAAEMQSAFNVSFGRMSKDAEAWAVKTGDALGRSTTEMQNAMLTMHGLFKAGGPATAQTYELSKAAAQLAQDLASFHNVSMDEALEKLRSGLSGEAEPLRKFNVYLTEGAVAAEAVRLGVAKTTKEITENGKILARWSLIQKGTVEAQGDVARTSESTANQIKAARAAFEELSITVGTKLLPAITPLVGVIGGLAEAFGRLPGPMQSVVVGAAALAAITGPVVMGMGMVVSVGARASTALIGLAAAGGRASVAMTALGRSMGFLLGPWGLVIGAITTAVGAYALAQFKAKTVSTEMSTVTDGLEGATRAYEDAVLSVATAQGKEKDAAIANLKIKRMELQARIQNARAALQEASIVAKALQVQQAVRIQQDRYNFRGDAPGSLAGANPVTVGRLNQAKADAADAEKKIAAATAALNNFERELAKPINLGGALGGGTGGAAAGASRAKKASDDAADAAKELADALKAAQEYFLTPSERHAREIEENLSVIRRAFNEGRATVEEYTDALQRAYNIKAGDELGPPRTHDLDPSNAGLDWVKEQERIIADQEELVRQSWERAVGDGVRAAMDGDLLGFLKYSIKNAIADTLTNAIVGALGKGGAGGQGGGILGKAGGMVSGALGLGKIGAGFSAGGIGGAMGGLGAALASNPVGWGIAAVGAVGMLFGAFGGGAKKAEKQAAALKKAEEELTKAREEAEAAAQKVIATAQERRGLEIRLMELSGNAAGALAAKRMDELAAIDASNRAMQEQVYAWEDANAAVETARANLSAAYERESSALESTRDKFEGFADSLRDFRQSLITGDLAMNSRGDQYAMTARRFGDVAGRAASGDIKALEELQGVSEEYLAASLAQAKTAVAAKRDLAAVRVAVGKAADYASTQSDVASQQLTALHASVAGLLTINGSVLSVRDAIAALSAALGVQSSLQGSTVAGGGSGPDLGLWAASGRAAGMTPDRGTRAIADWMRDPKLFLAEYNNGLAAGSLAAIDAYWQVPHGTMAGIAASMGLPAFANGGSFKVGGAGGIDSQLMQFRATPGEMVDISTPGQLNDNAKEMHALRGEVTMLKYGIEAIAKNTGSLDRRALRAEKDGMPIRAVDPEAPISVAVA